MALTPLSAGFQSLPLLPTIKLGTSGAASRMGGFVYVVGPCGVSPTTSPVRLGVSPDTAWTPTGVFCQWFEALFPHAGTVGCVVCHRVHQLLPHRPAAALPSLLYNLSPCLVRQLLPCRKSSPPGCCLHPSYRSGWMFLLYLLGCQTSIQFDFLSALFLFFFLIVVVLLLVVRGGTVCLPMPPSWPEVPDLYF